MPLEHALQLAVTLPHSQLFVAADEGHHFFRRRLRRILAMLIGQDVQAAGESAHAGAAARSDATSG